MVNLSTDIINYDHHHLHHLHHHHLHYHGVQIKSRRTKSQMMIGYFVRLVTIIFISTSDDNWICPNNNFDYIFPKWSTSWSFYDWCDNISSTSLSVTPSKSEIFRSIMEYSMKRVSLVYFIPLCLFKYVLKVPVWIDAKWHWLHLFDFSPLCVFKCVFKELA